MTDISPATYDKASDYPVQRITLFQPPSIEPRYWGLWNGKEWMLDVNYHVLHYPDIRLAKAHLIYDNHGATVREIGPDGLPVEES